MPASLPAQMHVVEISRPGGPEVLRKSLRPLPSFAPDEVLVKVAAAGVNRPDIAQRSGNYPPPPGASDIPGLELAGEVVACGAAVTRWEPGNQICALVSGGGYAQYCNVPEVQALPVPKGLSPAEAASLPETFFTVWTNVFERARLAPGETLLVQGGTSGIGVAAIQMASALGSRVIATAGSDEKCAACLALGAELAINYRTRDFVEAARQATGGKGVNVVLDMVGGSYVERELKLLAEDGRLVFIATLGGPKGEIDIFSVMRKRLTLTGSTLRPRPVAFKGAIAEQLRVRVWPLLESGRIRPVVFRSFPLAEAADAHRLLESSAHIGKIVLTMPPGNG